MPSFPVADVPGHNRAGLGFVPQDRHREGLVLTLSVAENATMTIPERIKARASSALWATPGARENTSLGASLIERTRHQDRGARSTSL